MRKRADGRTRCGTSHDGARGDADASYCVDAVAGGIAASTPVGTLSLSARRSEVPAMPEMLVAPAEQVSLLLYFPSSGASRIRTCGCDQALSHGGIGEPGRRECDRIV